MSRPLYAIGAEYLALNDVLDECEGDLSRAGELEMEAALVALMESLGTEQAEKFDSCINLIRHLRMEATAAQDERDRYAKLADLRLKRAAAIEERLKRYMEATGQKKVQTATGRTVSVVANGGALPLHLKEGTAVPPEYHRVVREVDRGAIRDALAAGVELDFAELLTRGTHLRVK